MTSLTAPYGSWASPLSASAIAAGAASYGEIQSFGTDIFWLESLPKEAGRVTLVRNGESILPKDFSVRSRVHEYGGGSYLVCEAGIYFVNFKDQELYQLRPVPQTLTQSEGGDPDAHDVLVPHALTRTSTNQRYADLCHPRGSNFLIAVCETHERDADGKSVRVTNRLVAIHLTDGQVTTLHEGHDFYASPRVRDNQLAFIAWDHPNMPWDATLLYLAQFNQSVPSLDHAGIIAGGDGESVLEPRWGEKRLFFLSDTGGWWNIWCFDESGAHCLHECDAEFGGPAWLFAMGSFAPVHDDLVIARRIRQGEEALVVILGDGTLTEWHSKAGSYEYLLWHDSPKSLLCVTGAPDRGARIEQFSPSGETLRVLAENKRELLPSQYASMPQAIEFESHDGSGYAYFYPPTNPGYQPPAGQLPPLLVTTHGGPTSAARRVQNLRIQYYTSRGWAVADLNYAGSTGFGSAYRRKLNGKWGIADVKDCESLVRHLSSRGLVDPSRCAIRGGSAGGYTTLAALTFSNVFHAGASAYGISDLEALANDTHKFESRYLDSLIGPWPQMREAYKARSPIHHTDGLSCPIIFFQGGKDLVVPPNQSERMVAALDRKGIPHAYLLYPEEAHGFRDAKNIVHCLESEFQFFCRVFDIERAEPGPFLDIKHL